MKYRNCKLQPLFLAMAISGVILGITSQSAAAAERDPDIYLGAGAGFTHFQRLKNINDGGSTTENAAAANAFAGYNLNNYLGAELGYAYAGRGNTNGQRLENQGGTLSLIGRVPLAGSLSLFGEAGGYWAHTDGLGTQDTNISSLLGAGISYQLTDTLDLQARWRYIADVAELHRRDDQTPFRANQTMTTLELVYHPFRADKVAPVPLMPPIPMPEPDMVDKTFELNSDVLFAFGKADLNPAGRLALTKLYHDLAAVHPQDDQAIVIGYTDRIGSVRVNQRLSEARAVVVADFLAAQGMPASKIRVEGRGATNPITGDQCEGIRSPAHRIRCLAPDRRVEVRLTGVKAVISQ
jgi:OOP family OmpA-OmpF porin